MPLYKILRNSSRFEFLKTSFACLLVFAGVLAPQRAHAQFKSERDRSIVRDSLKAFGHECGQRGSTDDETLKRLDVEAKDAGRAGNPASQKCFENYYSQIAGVAFLYSKLCRDISLAKKSAGDELAATQFLAVNHYQAGIRPFHSALNDCLTDLPEKRGLPYIIPLAGFDLDVRDLQKEMDRIKIPDPFTATFPVPAR